MSNYSAKRRGIKARAVKRNPRPLMVRSVPQSGWNVSQRGGQIIKYDVFRKTGSVSSRNGPLDA